ncbi:MAG: FG-GAP-like repeat-containing protein [Planctomycetota bacterium]
MLLFTPILVALAAQTAGTDFDLSNPNHWDGLGMSVFFLDDINGDGVAEFGSSAFCSDHQGNNSGSVYIYDGATQALIRRHDGPSPRARLGEYATSTGDFNGDGYRDYAAGARNAHFGATEGGSVYIWSGKTGNLMHRIDGTVPYAAFGLRLTSVPDVNGDGVHDLLVAAPEEQFFRGAVYLYSGTDGSLIASKQGQTSYARFGTSMSAIGDVTGDGIPEIIIGAPFAANERGEVVIVRGQDLQPISHVRGSRPLTRFGFTVKGAGDVNGDGLRDVLIGEPCSDLVWVFTPTTRTIIRRHQGPAGAAKAGYGHALSRAGDINQDGHPDYLLGHPGEWENQNLHNPGGGAEIFSGKDGTVLASFPPNEGDDGFGWSVAYSPSSTAGQVKVLIGSPAGGDLPGRHAPGIISGRVIP